MDNAVEYFKELNDILLLDSNVIWWLDFMLSLFVFVTFIGIVFVVRSKSNDSLKIRVAMLSVSTLCLTVLWLVRTSVDSNIVSVFYDETPMSNIYVDGEIPVYGWTKADGWEPVSDIYIQGAHVYEYDYMNSKSTTNISEFVRDISVYEEDTDGVFEYEIDEELTITVVLDEEYILSSDRQLGNIDDELNDLIELNKNLTNDEVYHLLESDVGERGYVLWNGEEHVHE